MTSLRISVRNTSAEGGTALTPFFAGFHDNSFDLYNLGEAASAGLEALAEDGNNSVVAGELVAADADAQSTNVVGDRGPIAAGERASAILDVNGASNGYLSLASMILPSNDAFVGTADALRLFDSNGRFFGAQTVVFTGESVRDAGTEYNTERDAAFINQTAPNTGLTEGGVVRVHEGFNGSLGNPDGILGNPNGVPGEQIILGESIQLLQTLLFRGLKLPRSISTPSWNAMGLAVVTLSLVAATTISSMLELEMIASLPVLAGTSLMPVLVMTGSIQGSATMKSLLEVAMTEFSLERGTTKFLAMRVAI